MRYWPILLLAGCATNPTIQTVEVKVPVPVSCLPPTLPERPKIVANAELLKLTDGALVLEIAAERLDLLSYTAQIDAILQACR